MLLDAAHRLSPAGDRRGLEAAAFAGSDGAVAGTVHRDEFGVGSVYDDGYFERVARGAHEADAKPAAVEMCG